MKGARLDRHFCMSIGASEVAEALGVGTGAGFPFAGEVPSIAPIWRAMAANANAKTTGALILV